LRQGGFSAEEVWHVRRDGSVFPALMNITAIKDAAGGTQFTSATVLDITERRRAEEAKQESEERFHSVVETSPDAIALLDLDGHILMASRQAARFFGFDSVDELLSAVPNGFELLAPEDRQRARDNVRRLIDAGVLRDLEYCGCRRDGSRFPAELSASLQRDAHGNPKAMIIVLRDITNRKRVAEALVKATRAAQAANRAKSEFLANMSHEIRTPMTAILGFSDLLMTPDLPYSEQREFLEGIQRNGKALLELIGDILDLSKIEAEKLTLEKVDCPLRPIVDDVLSAAAVWVERKGLRLNVDCEFSLPETIHTDPLRLRQILMNLLGNAVKFTSQGDVSFTIRCLREATGPARMQFTVSDTGIGIPADKIGDLFQPFTQVDGSANRRCGGTGLGLAISQRLATELGGDIQVASEWGKGSTFTLTVDPGSLVGIPMGQQLKPVATADPGRLPRAPRLPLRGRLLLAEDDPGIQQIIGLLLQKMNLEVTIAENGHTACDMAEKSKAEGRPYDLILMDIQMPKRNGYEATQWLRQHGWQGPIVALTAYAMVGDREKCLAAGCDDYIAKPVILTGLWDVLAPYLGRTALSADQIPEGDKAADDADVAAQ
jgi:PAS domain S-box-containing protein